MTELSLLRLADVHLTRGCSLAMLVTALPSGNRAGRALRHEVGDLLRVVLGLLTGRPPQSLQFEADLAGKPYLAGHASIAFNLSHSQSYSLIALSLGGQIGCDIEDRFGADDANRLGPLILHPAERQEMDRLEPQAWRDAFARYWVRKEAALKAAGSGFLKDPRTVIVGLDEAKIRWTVPDGPVLNLFDQRIAAGCFGAVASADSACSWHLLQP